MFWEGYASFNRTIPTTVIITVCAHRHCEHTLPREVIWYLPPLIWLPTGTWRQPSNTDWITYDASREYFMSTTKHRQFIVVLWVWLPVSSSVLEIVVAACFVAPASPLSLLFRRFCWFCGGGFRCVCACARARPCVRVCVCVCARASACVRACVCVCVPLVGVGGDAFMFCFCRFLILQKNAL